MGHFNSGTTDQGDAHGIIVSTRVGKSSLNLNKLLSEKISVSVFLVIRHLSPDLFSFFISKQGIFQGLLFSSKHNANIILSIQPTVTDSVDNLECQLYNLAQNNHSYFARLRQCTDIEETWSRGHAAVASPTSCANLIR